jgi:hypothetical protein
VNQPNPQPPQQHGPAPAPPQNGRQSTDSPEPPDGQPAEPSPAGSQSFQPILAERAVGRFEFLHRKPSIRARVALVLVTTRGQHAVFEPNRPPTLGELLWKGVRTQYEVDTGLHHTSISVDLPSNDEAFGFPAEIDLQWRVSDPSKVVTDGITDVREAMRPSLLARLRGVTRRFDIEDAAGAEQAANDELAARPVGVEFGLQVDAFLRLAIDQSSRAHASTMRGIVRETTVEDSTQVLRELRERHNRELLTGRVDHYRTIMAAGDLDQFALQLAQNPDDVQAVISMAKDERETNRRQTVDFVSRLIDSGAIDRWEIDDQVRTALQWLRDSTNRVIAPAELPERVGPDRGNGLPGQQLPNPALPNSADANGAGGSTP